MGQAKNRGDFVARKEEAIRNGRVKTPTVQAFHTAESFKLPGQESTALEKLMFKLSPGAERTAAELDLYPDLGSVL